MRWPRRLAATSATITVSSDAMAEPVSRRANACGRLPGQYHDEVVDPRDRYGRGERQRRPGKAAVMTAHRLAVDESRESNSRFSSWFTDSPLGNVSVGPGDNRLTNEPSGLTARTASPCSLRGVFSTLRVLRRTANESWCLSVATSSSKPLGQLLGVNHQLGLGLVDAVEHRQAESGQAGEHQRRHDHGHHGQAQPATHWVVSLPEPVAHAPNRAERQGVTELLAELADVRVHRAVVAVPALPPDAVQQLLA